MIQRWDIKPLEPNCIELTSDNIKKILGSNTQFKKYQEEHLDIINKNNCDNTLDQTCPITNKCSIDLLDLRNTTSKKNLTAIDVIIIIFKIRIMKK